MVGINNRNLKTFTVDLDQIHIIAEKIGSKIKNCRKRYR